MKAAYANVRTTQAAATGSKAKALVVALTAGGDGLSVAGLGLVGLGAHALSGDPQLGTVLHSLLWVQAPSLFARIGGGIYTRPQTSVPTSPAR